jgi:L-lactate dehydrogenase
LEKSEIKNFLASERPRGIDRAVPMGKSMDFSLVWDGYDLIRSLSRKVTVIQMGLKIVSDVSNRKVAVIGAGFVGASIVYSLMIKGLAHEIVLIERSDRFEKCEAEVNDIRHGMPHMGSSNIYRGGYSDIKDCDLIIFTAGRNRLPNETRLDMTADNIGIASEAADEIKKFYTKGVILVVTNPVDVITRYMTERLGLPDGMVFGTGCVLDSSRLINVIADYVGLSSDVVSAQVIGEHGESQIALWSKATIAGMPIAEYCEMTGLSFTDGDKLTIESRVRQMGTEIIKGKGRTHYGIATCVCYIADAVLNRRATIVSVTSVLKGEYNIDGVAMSLPSLICSNGVERRLTDRLNDDEFARLRKSYKRLDLCHGV